MSDQYYVAVIGAGPAGLFAARELARAGVKVVLFNRDIRAAWPNTAFTRINFP
jgi:flavin-dependent dehydrogenase